VYGAARTIYDRFGATISAVLVATVPWVVMFAPVAYVEGALIFYTALAIGWGLVASNGWILPFSRELAREETVPSRASFAAKRG
jgi:hypothetical protein